MVTDPVDELFGMKVTLDSARTANSAIELCHNAWRFKEPLSKEHFLENKNKMKEFKKELEELDRAVKRLPIDFRPISIDERIQYHNSLMAIPERYIDKIEKYESGSRNLRQDEVYMHFADLHLLISGTNDRAMAINKTIELLEKDTTLKELNKRAIERIKWADSYFSDGKDIPISEKKPHIIADLTWSYFNIGHPITEDGGYEIYDTVAIGHPPGWKTAYNKVHNRSNSRSLFRYIEGVHRKHRNVYKWPDFLCGPGMLEILHASDIMAMKLREGIPLNRKEQSPKKITYVA